MRQLLAICAFIATVAAMAVPVDAAVISAQIVTAPAMLGFVLDDFGASNASGLVSGTSIFTRQGETISFSGGPAAAGLYAGEQVAQRACPFAGTGLAESNYLVIEPGGSITITFAQAQTEFDLLWGTVDTYNHVSIGFGANTMTFSGAEVAAAAGGNVVLGQSNLAVEISGLQAFTTVTLTSDVPAFEFVPGVPVPEPASAALFGLGLLGLGAAMRRRAVARR